MATILGKSLIDKAQVTLQDPNGRHWARADLLDYLNDGQRDAVILKPDACVIDAPVALIPGTVKQALPAGGLSLVDVVCNTNAAGDTPGLAIRIVSREVLDAQFPNWRLAGNTSGVIQHFMYDPQNPKTFYVYPKAGMVAPHVQLVYYAVPEDTDDSDKVIGIDDIYANALLNYILYRAYAKDGQAAQNATLAAAYLSLFNNAFGIKTQSDAAINPNLAVTPFNPSVPGSAKV